MLSELNGLRNRVLTRLLTGELPVHLEIFERDAWSTLWRWHKAGEHFLRVTGSEQINGDFDLRQNPAHLGILCQLPGTDRWIVLARYEAYESIPISNQLAFCHPTPVITFVHKDGGEFGSGCINLDQCKTVNDFFTTTSNLPEEDGAVPPLHSDDVAEIDRCLMAAIPQWIKG